MADSKIALQRIAKYVQASSKNLAEFKTNPEIVLKKLKINATDAEIKNLVATIGKIKLDPTVSDQDHNERPGHNEFSECEHIEVPASNKIIDTDKNLKLNKLEQVKKLKNNRLR